ncbi:ATPase family AAA domain-containing protein 5 [Armadillidium nasatum]|uniref:ATPase family AAA domain-containing protein 5 n=1 Tax=Armadillidium nasatum TaxID=96803 RepID=A0A5N5T5S8_9CRUS|nr:ATPase family AAA domain-containing protein 5 [Armadillidium nasatum]
MTNRHKQNDSVNEISESPTGDSSEELCDSDSNASVYSVDEAVKENYASINSNLVPENGKNAFDYLMLNRQKFNATECNDYEDINTSPNHKKRKHKTSIKFRFNAHKNLSSNLDNSLEDFETASPDNEKTETSDLCSKKYVEKILISPSDLKSKLINENDNIDLEETFKEEIQECFSKKKKKRKKQCKFKRKSTIDLAEDSKEILTTGSGSDDELLTKMENKTVKVNVNQRDIKSFFKPSINIENKESNNNKKAQDADDSDKKISQNSLLDVSNKSLEINELNIETEDEELNLFKNRPSCLKQKTKLLREIRVQNLEKKCEPDFKTEVLMTAKEDSSNQIISSNSEKRERLDDISDANSVQSTEKESELISDGDFVSNAKNDTKLRRSSRTIKKPKPFEIFDTPQKKKTEIKNNLKENISPKISRKDKKHTEMPSKLRKSSSKEKARKETNGEIKINKSKNDSPVSKENSDDEPDVITISESPEFPGRNNSQLAPIFMKKKKVEISPTKLQARKDFFFSDVSETLKKSSQKSVEEQNLICPFPKFSHVRQSEDSELLWKLSLPNISSLDEDIEETIPSVPLENFSSISKISLEESTNLEEPLCSFPHIDEPTMCHCLSYYKSKFKNFPVISTFKSFIESKKDYINYYEKECFKEAKKMECKERSNGKVKDVVVNDVGKKSKRKKSSKSLSRSKRRRILQEELSDDCEIIPEHIWHKWMPYDWTQVFSPKSAEFFVGNLGPINRLKEFLTKWKSAFKSDDLSDKNSLSSLSDDSCDTNYESSANNAILISGPPGIGKTAAVYALAQDLGYKVLEINASSSRQGKQLMSQLSEATQSHNVTTVSSSQNSMFGYSDNCVADSIESTEKGKSVSLILIEDIDIVFEDLDEGFWSAVNTLLCTSKRPIIITTSLDVAYPIPKIKEKYEEVIFETPSSEQIAQYLQLICLANGVFTSSKEIELLVMSNKNDIRKCILDLQFWIMSGKCFVAWWQINNESFSKLLSEKKVNDSTLLEVFPGASKFSSMYVKIPISSGSIWGKEDAKFLKTPDILGENCKSINWAITSANCDTLLPFTKTEKTKRFKYPLNKDDPDLKRHSLWQKHSWLSLDSDSDNEKEAPSDKEEIEKEKTLPKELSRHLGMYSKSLSIFFSFFTDFDILSSRSYLSQKYYFREFHRNWWTPSIVDGLETDTASPFCSHYHDNLNSTLIPELSQSSLKFIVKWIGSLVNGKNNHTSNEIMLLLNLETSNNSSVMEPHFRIPISEQNKVEKLNQILSSELPSFTQLNRNSVVVDYIPYLREIARSDHVGEAIQKFKRSRRVIKHFSNLEIYSLSSSELLELCNVFHSVLA